MQGIFGIVPAEVYDLAIQPVVDFDWFDWVLINNEIGSTTGACIFSVEERNGTKKITEGFLKLKYIKEIMDSESAERLL